MPEPTLTCARCHAALPEDDAFFCYLAPCQGTALCPDCAGEHQEGH